MPKTLYTIGHSTRPLEELVTMLKDNGVTILVDVRTVPKSRTNPQARAVQAKGGNAYHKQSCLIGSDRCPVTPLSMH